MSKEQWVVMLAMATVAGCGDQPELRVDSFNVALAPGNAPLAVERVDSIAEALAASEADVICLQEVWTPDDYQALVEAGDYAATVRHPPGEPGVCLEGDLDAVEACVSGPCADLCGPDLFGCAMAHCTPTLEALVSDAPGCAQCTIQTVQGGACLEDVRPGCESGTPSSYIYTGYDTALLSRLPVLESETFALDSHKVRTAVSYARVDGELGPVDVYCAHFASSIGDIEYTGAHGSWQGEREFQIEQSLEYIRETSGDSRLVVLLGDLNERIGGERLSPIEEAGLRSAAEAGEPGCTVCIDNLLAPSGDDRRVDHVYLGEGLAAVSFERIFDEPVSIDTGEETIETHLSDHYGLRAVLSN